VSVASCWVNFAWLGWPGVARRQVTFFCFAKRKSPKKRRPCCLRPCASLRAPCGAQSSRGPRKLASLKQRAALIRLAFRSSAQTEGVGSGKNQYQQPATQQPNTQSAQARSAPDSDSDPPPVLAGPVLHQKSGIRAARCLSEASLRGPPLFWCSAGCPKRSVGTQTAGRLFFAYFLLAKQKQSE